MYEGFTEIQLSGKQLVFLFMSAVVLAVVIFLLGVTVGRGVRGAVGEMPGLSLEADAGMATTEVPDDSSVAAADDELTYHEMLLGESAPAAEATPTDNPPVPVTEPVDAPPSAPPAAVNPDAWFLQTGAYSMKEVADGQVEKLKQLNVPAFVLEPGSGSPTKLFRVRVGPYADRAEADQARSRLERQGYKPSITR